MWYEFILDTDDDFYDCGYKRVYIESNSWFDVNIDCHRILENIQSLNSRSALHKSRKESVDEFIAICISKLYTFDDNYIQVYYGNWTFELHEVSVDISENIIKIKDVS